MKNLIAITIVLIISNLAAANVAVEGNLDCGAWLDARKSNSSKFFEHYLIGTINGMALGRNIEIWNANGIKVSREQVYFWMDSYCQKNPLSYTITGAFAFANERTNGLYNDAVKNIKKP